MLCSACGMRVQAAVVPTKQSCVGSRTRRRALGRVTSEWRDGGRRSPHPRFGQARMLSDARQCAPHGSALKAIPPGSRVDAEAAIGAGGPDGRHDVALSTPNPTLVATLPTLDRDLLAAFAAAAAPNSLRALTGDFTAFEVWCHGREATALPAAASTVADYLRARDEAGAAPASLGRYKASIARVHVLARQVDPTRDPLVTLTLRAIRRERGTVQKQALPLRFKGAVKDVRADAPRGLALGAMLDGCGTSVIGRRDAALLSVAYDTGLRAAELVALAVEDLVAAIDADAGLILVRRTKSDQEGQGATAYLSPRSMRALRAWRDAAGVEAGALFRRVFVRRMPAKAGVVGVRWARVDDGMLRTGRHPDKPAVAAHTRFTVGGEALTPAAVTGIYRRAMMRAFEAGALPDVDAQQFAAWFDGVSAHSTRVGLTQDLFSAGEDLAGIMDALRWKTPRMPLLYNRNLAAESGAAGRVVGQL